MKNSILILVISCMVSCTSNTIFNKPDDLISKDSMVLLLSDLYLANSSKVYKNKFKERNIDYTYLVFEKYGIDSARFKRSNFYYTTKIDDYEKIYKEVEAKLKGLNDNFKGLKKIKDSIKRDSLRIIKHKRDSIKNAKNDSIRIKDSLAKITPIDSIKPEALLVEMDTLKQKENISKTENNKNNSK